MNGLGKDTQNGSRTNLILCEFKTPQQSPLSVTVEKESNETSNHIRSSQSLASRDHWARLSKSHTIHTQTVGSYLTTTRSHSWRTTWGLPNCLHPPLPSMCCMRSEQHMCATCHDRWRCVAFLPPIWGPRPRGQRCVREARESCHQDQEPSENRVQSVTTGCSLWPMMTKLKTIQSNYEKSCFARHEAPIEI